MSLLSMETVKKNSPVVTHSNQISEARYFLTLGEQRFVFLLVSMISPDDTELKDYEIKVSDFAKIMGIKGNSIYERLNDTLDTLLSRVLHIPTETGYLKIGWVSSAEYIQGKGTIKISFDKKMKPYLIGLKEKFTSYGLLTITNFKSYYTIKIYMLLKQYKRIGFREIDVIELRYKLGLEDDKYPLFKDFRKWVLNKAKREFETKNKSAGGYNSDITFDLETIRTGRKITRLRFIIKKQSYQEQLPIDLPEPEEKIPVILALEKHGIAEAVAKRFLEEQGEADILRCIKLYEENLQAGKVKNTSGGYLIKMLQAKAGQITEAEKQAEAKKKERAKAKKEAEKKERLSEQKIELERQFRVTEKKKFLASLSEERKAEILAMLKKESVQIFKNVDSLDNPKCTGFLLPMIPDFEKRQKAYVQENLK